MYLRPALKSTSEILREKRKEKKRSDKVFEANLEGCCILKQPRHNQG